MFITELLMQKLQTLHLMSWIAPLLIGVLYISVCSLFREPGRHRFNAVMIAGAGAAYLNGGLGTWEFAFLSVMVYVAYRSLDSYAFIGIGWLLHTCWDVVHYLYGNPIVPFSATSSFGCALCDPVIALWCFAGGPSVFGWLRSSFGVLRQADV